MKEFFLIALLVVGEFSVNECQAFYFGECGMPGSSDVHIGKTAVMMPLEKILLVRKDADYCAIKFKRDWQGPTEEDYHAEYESSFQGDKTGNFNESNLVVNHGELSFPKPRGFGRFAFSFGNREIKCGPIRLLWSGRRTVHFYAKNQVPGSYGIELAPTNWSRISDINLNRPGLKWYKYDENRKRENISIDQLGTSPGR